MTAHKVRTAAAVAVVCLLMEEEEEKEYKNKRKIIRKKWTKEFLTKRKECGFYSKINSELRSYEPEMYRNFLRMSPADFDYLLNLVRPVIEKQNTCMREAISAGERLALTLRFLASGDSYQSLMYLFRISVPAIAKIVPEVCTALYNSLKTDYLQVPQAEEQWLEISKELFEKWNFPNCFGALDGKHVVMKAPPNSGSIYFNYKKTYSIVLMALVDANYKFTFVDVGCNGRISDGGVFNNCSLADALERNVLNIPPSRPLHHGLEPVPYVIVADDAFALKTYLMKPFPQKKLTGPERIFNYRLSRARRLVENVFGIAAARFRILLKPIELNPEKTTKVVLAICALHNFLMTRKSQQYATPDDFDTEDASGNLIHGQWRNGDQPNGNMLPLQNGSNRNSCNDAKRIQQIFKNYFMEEGEVPWQYNCI